MNIEKHKKQLQEEIMKISQEVAELERLINTKKLDWLKLTAIIEWIEKNLEKTTKIEKQE